MRRTCRFRPSWMTRRRRPGETAATPCRSRRLAVVEHDSLSQAADRGRPRDARDLRQVLLLDAEPWVGEQLGQLAVVGEHEQALGLAVETADREHAGLGWNELEHRLAALGVVRSRHDADRLVKQVVHEARKDAHRSPVDLDEILSDFDPSAEDGDVAVDGDPPIGDEVLAGPAAAVTDPGEHLLEPLAFGLAHSPGSERSTFSSISTVEAGGTNAARGGRSSIESSPRRSRNMEVVPNRIGCPGPSSRPTACT